MTLSGSYTYVPKMRICDSLTKVLRIFRKVDSSLFFGSPSSTEVGTVGFFVECRFYFYKRG